MAVERLQSLLRHHHRIGLDSSIFIYQLDGNPRYLALTYPVFLWLEAARHSAVTSTITWAELLVPAYRHSEHDRIDRYVSLFAAYPQIEWIAPDMAIADMAAQIRARHALHTPDALQAATAIHSGATLFLTSDRAFRKIPELKSILLDDLL